MKTRYKITILVLIPVLLLMIPVMELVQYEMTMAKFEENCPTYSGVETDPYAYCIWPGGPPSKPMLKILLTGEK